MNLMENSLGHMSEIILKTQSALNDFTVREQDVLIFREN